MVLSKTKNIEYTPSGEGKLNLKDEELLLEDVNDEELSDVAAPVLVNEPYLDGDSVSLYLAECKQTPNQNCSPVSGRENSIDILLMFIFFYLIP